MKTVILIGDSIRMGYQQTVRQGLDGIAEVWEPSENGRNSMNVLAQLDAWLAQAVPDVIHVNCGLHDIKKEFGRDNAAVPLEQYAENVRTILGRLIRETNAQVIWASTTPVNEKLHHQNKSFDRFEADVVSYNAAASRVANEMGIPIDDLYHFVQRIGPDKILVEDGVHFTEEGSELLGKQVAGFIKPFLTADRSR